MYYKLTRKIIKRWPGFKTFGIFSFLPVFFIGGAAIEFAMIKWTPNGVNFYDVFRKNQIERTVSERIQFLQMEHEGKSFETHN